MFMMVDYAMEMAVEKSGIAKVDRLSICSSCLSSF